MLAWSCIHAITSVAGHLALARLCFSRMKGSLPKMAEGPWVGQKGNRAETDNSKSNNSKRRLGIAGVAALVVAVICDGGLWWHCNAVQERD